MGLLKLKNENSLLGASNHGGSANYLESNALGAGAGFGWVEESTADEVHLR